MKRVLEKISTTHYLFYKNILPYIIIGCKMHCVSLKKKKKNLQNLKYFQIKNMYSLIKKKNQIYCINYTFFFF